MASPSSYDAFGQAVAINSQFALVAAPFNSAAIGLVSVYENSDGAWTLLQELSGVETNGFFGFGVDIDANNQIIVGGSGGYGRGGAYVYSLDSDSGLFVLDSKISEAIGSAVAIDGDYAATGTTEDVLVFERASDGTWSNVADMSCDSCAST